MPRIQRFLNACGIRTGLVLNTLCPSGSSVVRGAKCRGWPRDEKKIPRTTLKKADDDGKTFTMAIAGS